eukprot:m.28883 g.28883  ORF g.28883 m.28883 type:complete len:191 (+) comp9085_c0_seq1:96-668(+)
MQHYTYHIEDKATHLEALLCSFFPSLFLPPAFTVECSEYTECKASESETSPGTRTTDRVCQSHTTTTTDTPDLDKTQGGSGTGLSSTVLVSIAVGVVALVCIIAAVAYLSCRRGRLKTAPHGSRSRSGQHGGRHHRADGPVFLEQNPLYAGGPATPASHMASTSATASSSRVALEANPFYESSSVFGTAA